MVVLLCIPATGDGAIDAEEFSAVMGVTPPPEQGNEACTNLTLVGTLTRKATAIEADCARPVEPRGRFGSESKLGLGFMLGIGLGLRLGLGLGLY